MNKFKLFIIAIFALLPVKIFAQVSPIPILEREIRENRSIKMRSTNLERVKRDANKIGSGDTNVKSKIKFAEIKDDFESIQKLQNEIIKAYTTGKKINYSRISKKSETMIKNALRLDVNLFGTNSGKSFVIKADKIKNQESVRTFIILLDRSIGKFVKSPIFKDTKIVDLKDSKNTQIELKKIIYLGQRLSILAGRKE
jgi:hypothetical protein